MDVANAALPAYVTVLLFFVGLLLRPQDQPKYWSWFAYINFLKYAWAAQMVNQYEHQSTYLPATGHMEIHNPDITGQVLMGDGRSVSPHAFGYVLSHDFYCFQSFNRNSGHAGLGILQSGKQKQMGHARL